MHTRDVSLRAGFVGAAIIGAAVATIAHAWTGPTAAPPGNNVYAPINISGAEQFKPGVIGANILNIYGASQYLNFGNTTGSSGFGIRNNAGILEFKNSSGAWAALAGSQWATSGSDIYYSSGNVGIGTAPVMALDVNGAVRGKTYHVSGTGADSGATPSYYGIFQEAGAWTSPYPDLRIQYHTGITYDAYQGYGGHRFFTGYDGSGTPTGLQLQITDKTHAARLTAGSAPGAADNTYYDIGAGRMAVNQSLYSYGKICAGESSGNCNGTGGVVISSSSIRFPDGTLQTTAAGTGDGPPGTLCGMAVSIYPGYGCSAGQGGDYSTTFTSIATCKGVNVAATSCPSGYSHITPKTAPNIWDPNTYQYVNYCMRMCVKQ